jgi:hypothetical protein
MNRRLPAYRFARNLVLSLLLLGAFAAAPSAFAGTLNGTVKNGTNGSLAVGVDVILIQLQGGMQPVANTKTDSQGRFHFDNPQLGTGPMLVRVVYKGVNYHEPITPGKMTADVEVFEPTDKASAFNVANHAIILQPNGSDLMVGEEYMISNKTQPPVAFYRADGSFDFNLPDGADFNQAAAWGAAGMPVVQGTIDKGKNKMAIAFPFRPGDSGVRLSYKVPYPGNHLTLHNVSPYSVDRLIIAAPPTVQVSGAGITSAGQDQGFNVYTRENVAANSPIEINVSGTAPNPPPAQSGAQSGGMGGAVSGGADESQNPSVNSRAETSSGADAPSVSATTIPARLDSLKWILVGGFASIFVLGFAYLWLRPQPAVATNGTGTMETSIPEPRSNRKPAASSIPAGEAQPVHSNPIGASAKTVAGIDSEVRGSLDELKDSIFRLELRRQAGTISEEDYTRERARVEKTLRDLVQG